MTEANVHQNNRSRMSCRLAISFVFVLFLFNGATRGEDIPTLFPADPFNAIGDAEKLRNALQGFGTDEQAIVDVLCERVVYQRTNISSTYSSVYGRDLTNDLKGELSGVFQTTCLMLSYATHEFLAIELHDAMAGTGCDEASMTEILMSRTNQEMADTRDFYAIHYGRSLISDIQSETSGSEQDLLVLLAQGLRDEDTTVNVVAVSRDVDSLYNAGQGQDGTDEAVFVEIFGTRSWSHLDSIFNLYLARYNYPLESVIRAEFSDAIHDSLMNIFEHARSKESYFATRIFLMMFGPTTRDNNLIRLIISRCEIDLENIKNYYQIIYGRSLASDVSSDTCCSYGTALLTLIG